MLRRLSFPVLVALAAAALPSLAVEQAAPPAPTLEQRIDAYIRPYLEVGHLSGTLLVGRGEAVVYEKSFGLANREHGVRNTPRTRFCVASITKPMTLIVAVRMAEAGKLAPADTLAKWIPDFPRGDTITVEHLLRHRAGIPHRVMKPSEETQPRTAAEMVERVKQVELLFEPGAQSVYSSAGFSVLARVLELAGGKPFPELLAEYVLEPAGMERTVDPAARTILADRAQSYFFDLDHLVNAPPKDLSFLVGAGSVYSTPADLFRLQRALLAGRLGEGAKLSLLRDGGLRWNGATHGFRAFADFDGETGVSVVYASNLHSGAADRIRRDLPKLIAGEPVVAEPVDTRFVSLEESALRRYEGAYRLRPGRNISLRVRDGRLRADGWLLVPTSRTTFFSPQDYARIEVVLDKAGEVERLDWTAAGETFPMPRVGPPEPE